MPAVPALPAMLVLHALPASLCYACFACFVGRQPSLVQEVCLHSAVAMTHDSALLLSVLRQLSGTQVVALAQYLLKLMTKYAGELAAASDVSMGLLLEACIPSALNVLGIFCRFTYAGVH